MKGDHMENSELTREEKIMIGRRAYHRAYYQKNKKKRMNQIKKAQENWYLKIYEQMQKESENEQG